MQSVAIVTIETFNYGNRLQNYALQQVLRSLGYTVKTLPRMPRKKGAIVAVKRFIQKLLQSKTSKFREFNLNIDFAESVIGRDEYPQNLNDKFDFFIAGSDQIWNPYFEFAAGKCDFLDFADATKRISYAASFGVDEIPEAKKMELASYLKQFSAISVREHEGAKIVADLIGKEAKVVLDPTFLLNCEEWKKMEKKPLKLPKRKYVLIYALGEKSQRFSDKIEQLKNKYEIYDIRSHWLIENEIPIGPSEFLYLIHNAEMVLTDSFHATAFSVIYHKKFIVYNRVGLDMNSRIKSLSKMLKIYDCLNEYNDLIYDKENDYIQIDRIIDIERERSMSFLRAALKC